MPLAAAAPAFYLDFDRSGSFTDVATKNVTDQVKRYEISRGKSKDFVDRYVIGTCTLVVHNTNGYWSGKHPGGTDGSGAVTGYRTTLANHQPAVESDEFFATSGAASANARLGQSFKNGKGRWIDRVDCRLKRTGTPGGTITAYIFRNSGDVPTVQKDNPSVSRAVTIANIGTSYEWVSFTFEKKVAIPASTTYWIVLVTTGYTRSAGVNELSWGKNGATGFSGGHASSYNGTAWSWLDNGIANPSFETNTTGWSAIGGSIARVTTEGYDGGAALQVDPTGSVGTEGALCGGGATAAAASTAYTFRIGIKGTAGLAYRMAWDENNGGAYLRTQTSGVLTLVGTDWNWFTLSASTGINTTNVNLYVYHNAVNSTRFYIDKAQFSPDSNPQGDFKFRVTANDIEVRALRLWVTTTYGGNTGYRFYGQLSRWSVNPDPRVNEATLVFKDPLAELEKTPLLISTLRTSRYLAHQTEASMLGDILDAANIGASQRSIGSELTMVPYAVYPRMSVASAIGKIVEASGGFFFFQAASEAAGYYKATFRSSNYENWNSSVENWGSELKLSSPTALEEEERTLATQVTVMSNPRKPQTPGVVWEYEVPVRFGPGQQKTIWAELRDACDYINDMASGTDYTTGFTLTSLTKYPGSGRAKIVITNSDATNSKMLTRLQLRGRQVSVADQVAIQVDNADGQAVTPTRDLTGVASPTRIDNEFIQNQDHADAVGRRYVERNLREPTYLTGTRDMTSASAYPSLLNRDVGDIVSIVFPTTTPSKYIGVNGDYIIDTLTEKGAIAEGTHSVEYRLREVGRAITRRFAYDAAGRGYDSGAAYAP